MSDQRRWSALTLDELVDRYRHEIEPAWRAEVDDPDRAAPPARWLDENGYGGLRYALREHHDRTYREFLEEDVGVEFETGAPATSSDGDGVPGLDVDDPRTREALGAYWASRVDRDLLAPSTLASKRSRLKLYLDCYREVHGTDAIVPAASDADDQPTEIRRAYRACDRMGERLDSDGSRETYLKDVGSIYRWLEKRGYTAFDPLADAEDELGDAWTAETPDNPALTAEQVERLRAAAETPGETLLVVGLAAWGLRPSELAALHASQLVLEGDDAHVAFEEERKNGPGTVSMLVGREAVADRIEALADGDAWNGYLFPSDASATGHVHADTIRARFGRLAERAGVEVDGETPTPKMGRRYWYSAYMDASAAVLEQLEFVAAEQGSSSAAVVRDSYISEARRRRLRRRFMRDHLAEVFSVAADPADGE